MQVLKHNSPSDVESSGSVNLVRSLLYIHDFVVLDLNGGFSVNCNNFFVFYIPVPVESYGQRILRGREGGE